VDAVGAAARGSDGGGSVVPEPQVVCTAGRVDFGRVRCRVGLLPGRADGLPTVPYGAGVDAAAG
jgi:hypothetical protein